MNGDPAVWWRGDRELVEGALAEARHVGVPEPVIQDILQEAASGLQDELTVPILAGRLASASQSRRKPTRRPTGPSVFEQAWKATRDDDDG